jgi:hypothetical protein
VVACLFQAAEVNRIVRFFGKHEPERVDVECLARPEVATSHRNVACAGDVESRISVPFGDHELLLISYF